MPEGGDSHTVARRWTHLPTCRSVAVSREPLFQTKEGNPALGRPAVARDNRWRRAKTEPADRTTGRTAEGKNVATDSAVASRPWWPDAGSPA